jgi:CheY-like chemotaxis protein
VVETGAAVRRAAGLFSHTLRGDIHVELRMENDLWPIRVDPAQFELALLNVAVNARDAMPEGGSLVIAARNLVLDGQPEGLHGRFVSVALRDTGEGIPREVLERVLEPFFTTKPPGKGTGLGLSQAHGFARQAGGALTIESEPGRGTEVAFLLAAAPEGYKVGDRLGAEVSGQTASAPSALARVLVVDDDTAVRRLTVEMLEGMGWRAAAVGGAEEALELLGVGERFDAVLSDVLMPGGMSGVRLAREIGRRWPGMPVLLATGYAGVEGVEPHGFPVLQKPFATTELAIALKSLLARRTRPTPD